MARFSRKFEFNRRFSEIVNDMISGYIALGLSFIRLQESIRYYAHLGPGKSLQPVENRIQSPILRFDSLDYSVRLSLVKLYKDHEYVTDFNIANPNKKEALQSHIEYARRLALEVHDEIIRTFCSLDLTLVARLLDIAHDLDYDLMCLRYNELAKWPTIEAYSDLNERFIAAIGNVVKLWNIEDTDPEP